MRGETRLLSTKLTLFTKSTASVSLLQASCQTESASKCASCGTPHNPRATSSEPILATTIKHLFIKCVSHALRHRAEGERDVDINELVKVIITISRESLSFCKPHALISEVEVSVELTEENPSQNKQPPIIHCPQPQLTIHRLADRTPPIMPSCHIRLQNVVMRRQ